MAVLSFSGLGQSFGDYDVFKGASGNIPHAGKVGLVGPNGVGKTTLLRILAGHEEPSGGGLHISKGTRIGYLRQEAMQAFKGQENTVWQEMLTVFAGVKEMEHRLATIEQKMADGSAETEDLDQYAKLQTHFESIGGYDYELRIKQVLDGLGFSAEFHHSSLNILSGGQKTRALLARLLLEKPDLLILDEPTNHLDIQAVEWLEGTLRIWDGAILIVSHDRYFLDRVVDTIWELSQSGIEAYRGNYSHYVTQRVERWERRQAEFDTLQDRFLKELDYIKRNIARDSTKNMAVGRLKRLVRQVKMVQNGGVEAVTDMTWAEASDKFGVSKTRWEVPDVEQAIKSLPRPSGRFHSMKIGLNAGFRSGTLVLRSKDLEIGYPTKSLFEAEDIELRRLERAALIGPNGTGKSTFLKTLIGRLEPLAGELILGASLKVGYFAQAHDELNPENTVLDEIIDHSGMLISAARTYLGRFLFRGDDVYKPISLLSGGERGRLALAILSLEDANFLLMDEPTNHLDISSQEALQQVMSAFNGTILMVSHDRYLVDKLATQVWDLQEGQLRVFNGGYQEYLAQRDKERAADKAARQIERQQQAAAKAPSNGKPKLSKNEIRRRQQRIEEVEAAIEQQEAHLETVSAELQKASASNDVGRIQQASNDYAAAEEKLADLMQQWEALAEELEEV